MVDVQEERRCPNCGALVSSDAEWCGQCLERLVAPGDERGPGDPAAAAATAAPATAAPGSAAPGTAAPGTAAPGTAAPGAAANGTRKPAVAPEGAYWPCPVCETRNPIEAPTCLTCGTSFVDAMRKGEEQPSVEPKEAFSRSLLFPGLGHRALGRPLDGLARGVLFAVSFLMALAVASAGVHGGPVFAIFVIFLVFALVIYFGSAIEAYRLAQGELPLVSSKALLWTVVGIVLASVLLLALSVASASGG